MIHWYQLVLLIGSTARLTRLTTRDTITNPLRDIVLFNRAQRRARKAGEPVPAPARPRAARVRAWLHTLITCDWCIGVWVSVIVVLVAWPFHGTPLFVLVATILTVAYAVGWITDHEAH